MSHLFQKMSSLPSLFEAVLQDLVLFSLGEMYVANV